MAETHYFLGCDPAPAQQEKSDEGALVIERARLLTVEWSDNPSDWQRDMIFARSVKHVGKARARTWSGAIHGLHRSYGFTRIALDAGAAGGGPWIKGELSSTHQSIEGLDQECTPIVTADDTTVAQGQFILMMIKRGDALVEMLCPELSGDDQLNDFMYSLLREDLDHAALGLMPPLRDLKGELKEWSQARREAAGAMAQTVVQLSKFYVMTKDDGTYLTTKRGSRQFGSVGRKDLVSGLTYANFAFHCWLKSGEGALERAGSKDVPFGGFR